MAIIPKDLWPLQTISSDANYPQGKAKNVSFSGAGDGTPLEQRWINDLWGFQQALLNEAGVTPSGTPDEVGTSDYLDAIQAIIGPVPGISSTYQLEVMLFQHFNINDRFQRISNGGWLQTSVADAGEILFHLPAPTIGKIDELHVIVDGRDGTFGSAHSGLPLTLPQLALKRSTATPGNTNVTNAAVGSTATDSSASAAAYDTVHLISKTGMDHTILADTSYWVSLKGETGANALANSFAVYRCYAVIIP